MKFHFNTFPILESERLTLREITLKDNEQIFFLRTDNEVNKFIYRPNKHKTVKEAEDFIIKIRKGTETGENINWGITIPNVSEIIGSICLWNFSEDRKVAEVGYDLHPQYQGKGYMSEALKAVLKYGFEELDLEEIEAFTEKENESSKTLLIKNDFQLNANKVDADNANNSVYHIKRKD